MTRTKRSVSAWAIVALVTLPLAAVLLLVAAPVRAQSSEEATSRISISSADGALEWQVENRSYDVVHYWPAGAEGPRTLLLDQTVTATRRSDLDGAMDPLVRVVASNVATDGGLTPAWEIAVEADDGGARHLGPFGEAYVATHYGCCGALDALYYFSLRTGAALVVANGPIAMLEVPNSGGLVRLAGVQTPWSMSFGPQFEDYPDRVGILSYASLTDGIERIAIVARGAPTETMDSLMALPVLEWVADGEAPAGELTLWALDGERDAAKLSGVSLRITYTPDAWVEIPLAGDRFDIDAATLAPALSLERLP